MRLHKFSNPLKSLYTTFNLTKQRSKDMNIVILSFASFYIFLPITTGAPLTNFATKLGAGDFFYSVLIAMPVLGNALQIFASIILERTKKRKKLFIICGIIARGSWILIGLIPLLVLANGGSNAIYWILALLLVSSVSNSMLGVGFFSWMGDLIPTKMLGRYFGIRESIGTIVCLLSTLLVSLYLDSHTSFESYAIVFAVAGIAGIIDILGFIFITDIPMKNDPHPPLKIFIKKAMASKSFVKYIIFWSLWSLSFNMSGAFYNLYALSYLNLSFFQVAVAGQIAYSTISAITAPKWGGVLDKSGIHHVLMRSGAMSSIIPLIMLFSVQGSMWTFLIFSLFNGLTLTAVNNTAQKMLMSSTPNTNRTMYIALYSATTSICAVVGYLLGGALLELLGDISFDVFFVKMDRYKILFSSTGILRLLIVLLFAPAMTKLAKTNET